MINGIHLRVTPVLLDLLPVLRDFRLACERCPIGSLLIVETDVDMRVMPYLVEFLRGVVSDEHQG